MKIDIRGRRKVSFLRTFLPYDRGIASHDTIHDVMNALDGDLFSKSFITWQSGLQRRSISRLPDVGGNNPGRKKFEFYSIGCFHIDIAKVSVRNKSSHDD